MREYSEGEERMFERRRKCKDDRHRYMSLHCDCFFCESCLNNVVCGDCRRTVEGYRKQYLRILRHVLAGGNRGIYTEMQKEIAQEYRKWKVEYLKKLEREVCKCDPWYDNSYGSACEAGKKCRWSGKDE